MDELDRNDALIQVAIKILASNFRCENHQIFNKNYHFHDSHMWSVILSCINRQAVRKESVTVAWGCCMLLFTSLFCFLTHPTGLSCATAAPDIWNSLVCFLIYRLIDLQCFSCDSWRSKWITATDWAPLMRSDYEMELHPLPPQMISNG